MSAHIAVIDDSKYMLAQTRAVLEHLGYSVSCFVEPSDLDPRALEGTALVLVDVNMREVFGDDIVGYLKDNLSVRAPVLLFSGLGEEELARRASQSGADGYVLKSQDIGAQVQRFLGARHV